MSGIEPIEEESEMKQQGSDAGFYDKCNAYLNTIMSGPIEEEIEMKQPEQSDAGFYDKCLAYLNASDPEDYNYYSLRPTIEADIEDKVDLNQYIKAIFAAHDDSSQEKEKRMNVLKQATATVYRIYKEKEINLGLGNNSKDAIYADLIDVVGIEISGEIMSFLDNYGT